ncbi:MAG: YwiC-like family protein [Cyanobacteria bacterium J06626_18]
MTPIATPSSIHIQPWWRPTVSPEHGVYVILVVSFLTGVAAAHQWTWATTLALIGAYCGFQAEHPLVWQIRQRHSWKPRLLLWAGVYGGVTGAIAIWLVWQSQEHWPFLLIYGAVMAAALVDGVAVWQRQQKSILNELVAFAAVCLAALLAYSATTGTLSQQAIGLWILNTLYFSSAIFTVKLWKMRTTLVKPGLIFHGVALGLVLILWQLHWLSLATASALSVAILKGGLILWQKDWYYQTKIQQVAQLETGASLLFGAIVITTIRLMS